MDGVIRDAWWAYLEGRNTEARAQARHVFDDARRRGEAADVAAAEQLLGMVARDELDLAPARAHLTRAVDAWRGLRGEAHLSTMHARAQSAYLRLEEGDKAGAVAEAESLRPLVASWAPPHPRDAVEVLVILALANDTAGKVAESAEALRAIDADLAAQGATPDLRGTVKLHLAGQLHAVGDRAGACEVMAECVRLRVAAFGAGVPRVAFTRFSFVNLLMGEGRYEEALSEAEAGVEVIRKHHLERSARMGLDWLSVCLARLEAGRADKALEAVEHAEAIDAKRHGALRPMTARALAAVGGEFHNRGAHGRAAPLLGRALGVLVALGEGEPQMVESYMGALTATGRHRVAREQAQAMLTKRGKVLSDGAVASLTWAIAQSHLLDGRRAEAEPFVERAIAAAKLAYGPDSAITREYANHLAMLRSGAIPRRKSLA